MQLRKPSTRMSVSAILVAAGAVSTATAFILPPTVDGIALLLFFSGVMLMGAGVLCPFRCTIYGTVAGFLLAVYLFVPCVHITDNADETFKNVAVELGLSTVGTRTD